MYILKFIKYTLTNFYCNCEHSFYRTKYTFIQMNIYLSSQYSNFISDAPLISRNDSIKLGNLGNDTHLYKY